MALSPKHWLVWRHLQETGQRICCWSVRAIARALSISRSTVELALKALNALGIIRTRPGDRTHPSQHEILRTVTISEDTGDPIHRDTRAIGTPQSGHPRPIGTPQSGHPPAEFCSNCGVRLQPVSRASTLTDEARARLTTDGLSSEIENKEQVGQSVLEWVTGRCGQIKNFLTRRQLEVQVQRIGKSQEELIIRFFEWKWLELQERHAKGVLPYVSPGLFTAMLREGEFQAWKNLNAPQLASEARWNQQVAEAEEYRKRMGVAEQPMSEAEIAAIYREATAGS